MKRSGILNPDILRIVATAGHGDLIAITDRGFPLSRHPITTPIDVSVVPGVPSVADLLQPLADSLTVEGLIVAEETHRENEQMITTIHSAFPNVPERTIPHTEFKELVLNGGNTKRRMISQIRTGEFSRYGNVILICGVAF